MITTDAGIWDQILARIETKVNRHSFYTWFRPTVLVSDGGNQLTIRVPNPLFKDWLTKHYSGVLAEALAEVRRPGVSVLFVAEGAPSVTPEETTPPTLESGAPPTAAAGGLNP